MHVYIYDSYLENQKYSSLLAKIETRITDLGLSGKIIRLNPMHNIERTLKDEAKKGQTLVFVGNDQLIHAAINVLASRDATIGIIPVGRDKNTIAESLGIEREVLACDTLAARRIAKVDLGLANNQIFLTELSFNSSRALIDIGSNFTIETKNKSLIKIINLSLVSNSATNNTCEPTDGLLELLIESQINSGLFKKPEQSQSFLQNANFFINSNEKVLIDKAVTIDSPVKVSVIPNGIQIIVGKVRNF